MLGIGRSAEWLAEQVTSHPKTTIGLAGLLGVYRGHPWRKAAGLGSLFGAPTAPWSTGSYVSEAFLGDPDARAKIMHAAIGKGLADTISPLGDASIPGGPMGHSVPFNSYAPSGSMLFGMYNARLK